MIDFCHHHLVETWLQLCSQGCSSGLTKSPKATAAFAWRQLPGQLQSYFSDCIQLPGSFRSFFGHQVPQFSNVSNICLKCQLISICKQRGIKLTCAAEEPATTTAWLQQPLHQQLLSPEEKPETLSSFVFCSVLAFSDTQHYHLPIHVDGDIPSLVWWIQRNIDGTLWCILYHMNPSHLHIFMRTRHYSKHCHKFKYSSDNSIC